MELVFGSFLEIAGTKWQGDDLEAVAAVSAAITTVEERVQRSRKASAVFQ